MYIVPVWVPRNNGCLWNYFFTKKGSCALCDVALEPFIVGLCIIHLKIRKSIYIFR